MDQKWDAQLLYEKFVSIGTDNLKHCIHDTLECVLEIESKIKTRFCFQVSAPEIVLLMNSFEEGIAIGLDWISAIDV